MCGQEEHVGLRVLPKGVCTQEHSVTIRRTPVWLKSNPRWEDSRYDHRKLVGYKSTDTLPWHRRKTFKVICFEILTLFPTLQFPKPKIQLLQKDSLGKNVEIHIYRLNYTRLILFSSYYVFIICICKIGHISLKSVWYGHEKVLLETSRLLSQVRMEQMRLFVFGMC